MVEKRTENVKWTSV